MTPPPTRIAVCQQRTHWRGEDNTAAIVDALARTSIHRAQICLFPELAVSGIHRQITSVAQPDIVAGWVDSIRAACARWRITASAGAPSFTADPPWHVQDAQAFARRCGAHVVMVNFVMVNWPNALNRPEESADAGASVVIDPQGRILLTLPKARACPAVFDLGATDFVWGGEPSAAAQPAGTQSPA